MPTKIHYDPSKTIRAATLYIPTAFQSLATLLFQPFSLLTSSWNEMENAFYERVALRELANAKGNLRNEANGGRDFVGAVPVLAMEIKNQRRKGP